MSHFVSNIDPQIFNLGFLQLRWYGIFFVGGFLIALLITKHLFKYEGVDSKDVDDYLLYTLIVAIIGARLFHCLFYEPQYYLSHPIEILYVWKGGLASHGGMIGAIVVFYIYAKTHNVSILWLLSRVTIGGVVAGAFIRVGNFFNSEILGKASDVPWAIIFTKYDNTPRHPVMLYEAVSYLLIGSLLYIIYKKIGKTKATYILPGTFLILVFSARYFLEYFKLKQAHYSLDIPFTTGQLLSIPAIIYGVFVIIWGVKKLDLDSN